MEDQPKVERTSIEAWPEVKGTSLRMRKKVIILFLVVVSLAVLSIAIGVAASQIIQLEASNERKLLNDKNDSLLPEGKYTRAPTP